LDSEEKVNVSPSRKARKVSICDVLAAPAEPDAPCDTPTKRAGGRANEQTRKPESKPCTPLKHPGLLVMAALNQASHRGKKKKKIEIITSRFSHISKEMDARWSTQAAGTSMKST